MQKFLLTLVVLFAATFAANAQQKYEWKQYGLSFKVPTTFKISENTAESFAAGDKNMDLAIQVIDYDGVDAEDMGGILGELAVEAGMDMEEAEIGELALTTLAGAYIEGEIDGEMTILVVLMDVESNIALFARITYADGFLKQANNICNSFAIK